MVLTLVENGYWLMVVGGTGGLDSSLKMVIGWMVLTPVENGYWLDGADGPGGFESS